jgi:hypothetical protein
MTGQASGPVSPHEEESRPSVAALTDVLAAQGFHPGDPGLRLPDWLHRLGPNWLHRLGAVEKWTEQLVHFLRRWALVDLLQILAAFGLVWSACLYITSGSARRRAANSSAWQVLNASQGKPGNGGRVEALQTLVRNGEELAEVKLDSAFLFHVNMRGAYLGEASLQGAMLNEANLRDAFLNVAHLQDANLWSADLRDASFGFADLRSADLYQANLEGTDLTQADLTDASLRDIRNWRKIRSLNCAIISGVHRPPTGFLRWALDTAGAVDSASRTPEGTSRLKSCAEWRSRTLEPR